MLTRKNYSMTTVTPEEVRSWPYVKLLAMLGESNLPPGGMDTVRRLILDCHLRSDVSVLHAGCNAGFLSREIARRSGCNIIGIDISSDMVEAARKRMVTEGLDDILSYECQDMRSMSFVDNAFDVVLSGGALAFVDGHTRAIQEWVRVTRPYGLLADAEFYYHTEPPTSLLQKVSEVIEVEVPCYPRSYWFKVFEHALLQPYCVFDAEAGARSTAEIKEYCQRMVDYAATDWTDPAKEVLIERLIDIFHVFNENMKYLSYSMLIFRRMNTGDEPSLYT